MNNVVPFRFSTATNTRSPETFRTLTSEEQKEIVRNLDNLHKQVSALRAELVEKLREITEKGETGYSYGGVPAKDNTVADIVEIPGYAGSSR